jgi:hypothetical protein
MTIAIGELFARQYVERGAPVQDNTLFRNRIDAFLQANHYKDYADIATYLRLESGLIVGTFYSDSYKTVYYKFTEFFTSTKIELVLSSLTLIWRFLHKKYPEALNPRNASTPFVFRYPKADAWHAFITRAMREENVAYSLDEKCGVHFFVDEEFELNRFTALSCLAADRYAAVRVAFEQAHSHLDAQPSDTKAAVRSAFEALEILARLMDTNSKNLNKWMVENKLKPIALAQATDPTESAVLGKLFDGLAITIDGLHSYRHGQGSEQPVAPSLSVAVYIVSIVASTLRWLVAIDSNDEVSN